MQVAGEQLASLVVRSSNLHVILIHLRCTNRQLLCIIVETRLCPLPFGGTLIRQYGDSIRHYCSLIAYKRNQKSEQWLSIYDEIYVVHSIHYDKQLTAVLSHTALWDEMTYLYLSSSPLRRCSGVTFTNLYLPFEILKYFYGVLYVRPE